MKCEVDAGITSLSAGCEYRTGCSSSPAHRGQHSPATRMVLTHGEMQRIWEQVVTPPTHMQFIQEAESANQLLASACSRPSYMHPETVRWKITTGCVRGMRPLHTLDVQKVYYYTSQSQPINSTQEWRGVA